MWFGVRVRVSVTVLVLTASYTFCYILLVFRGIMVAEEVVI